MEKLKHQIIEVQDVMRENVEKTIKRGQDLEELEKKSDQLSENAVLFNKKSRSLRCKEQMKNYKLWAILLIILLAIIIVILYFAAKKA
jgi:hypothetical protein